MCFTVLPARPRAGTAEAGLRFLVLFSCWCLPLWTTQQCAITMHVVCRAYDEARSFGRHQAAAWHGMSGHAVMKPEQLEHFPRQGCGCWL